MPLTATMLTAIKEGDINSIRALFNDSNLNDLDPKTNVPAFCLAFENNKPEIAEYFILHPKFDNYWHATALQWAVYKNNVKLINYLIKQTEITTKSIATVSQNSETVLSFAIRGESIEGILICYKFNADVNHSSVKKVLASTKNNEISKLINTFLEYDTLKKAQVLDKKKMTEVEQNIGEIYRKYEHHEEAAKWFTKTAKENSRCGMWYLAIQYANGIGVPKNLEEAMNLFTKGYPLWSDKKDKDDFIRYFEQIAAYNFEALETHFSSIKAVINAKLVLLEIKLNNFSDTFKQNCIDLLTSILNEYSKLVKIKSGSDLLGLINLLHEKFIEKPESRNCIIDLFLLLQKNVDTCQATTQVMVNCYNDLMSKEKNAPSILIEYAIKNRFASDIKTDASLAKALTYKACQIKDKQEALVDYQLAYKLDKNIKTLFNLTKTQYELKPESDFSKELEELRSLEDKDNSLLELSIDNNLLFFILFFYKNTKPPFSNKIMAALKNINKEIKPFTDILFEYNPTLSLEKKAELELKIADIYKQQKQVDEAIKWYKLSSQNGNPDAAFAMANYYNEGQILPKDLNQAVILYKTVLDKRNLLKNSATINSTIKSLETICETSIVQDQKDIRSTYTTIFNANTLLTNFYLKEPEYKNIERIKFNMKNWLQAFEVLSLDKESKVLSRSDIFEIKFTLLQTYYFSSQSNPEKNKIRSDLLDLLLLLQKNIHLEPFATRAIIACCKHTIFTDKNYTQKHLDLIITCCQKISFLSKTEELTLIESLKLRAKTCADKKLATNDLKQVYKLENDISTLFEIVTLEYKHALDDAKKDCDELTKICLDKSLNEEKIFLLERIYSISKNPDLGLKINSLKKELALENYKKQLDLIKSSNKDVLANLINHPHDQKNPDHQKVLEKTLENLISGQVLFLKDNKYTDQIFPMDVLATKEIYDKNPIAKLVNTLLEKSLNTENWYCKLHLTAFYFERYKKYNAIKSGEDKAAEYLEKSINLLDDVLKNTNASMTESLRNQLSMILEHGKKSSNFKVRTHAFSIIARDSKINFSENQQATIDLAKENYLPALCYLAEMHKNYRSGMWQTLYPQYRRAISLFLKASILLAGLTNDKAAHLFKVSTKQIQYWREISIDFIKSVAKDKTNPYQKYANWADIFINLLIKNDVNCIAEGITPSSLILTALNKWETFLEIYTDLSDLNIDPQNIKKTFISGIYQALQGPYHQYYEENLIKDIIPSNIVKLLSSANTNHLKSVDHKIESPHKIPSAPSLSVKTSTVPAHQIVSYNPPPMNPAFMPKQVPEASQQKTSLSSTARIYPSLSELATLIPSASIEGLPATAPAAYAPESIATIEHSPSSKDEAEALLEALNAIPALKAREPSPIDSNVSPKKMVKIGKVLVPL